MTATATATAAARSSYRGKYPARVASVSSISLFPGLYMLITNAGDKFTVSGRDLDAVKDHLKADVSAFPNARKLAATAATRGEDRKAVSVTLTYEDGETVTHTPEIEAALKSFNVCQHVRGKGWQIVNPVPYKSFTAARRDRDALLEIRPNSIHADFQIYSVAVCQKNGFASI